MIDYSWISDREGGQKLEAYIPMKRGRVVDNSGVTVATGVDLGQRDWKEVMYLPISDSLKTKLRLYLEQTGETAKLLLESHPLKITKSEADELDRAVYRQIIARLKTLYNRESKIDFDDLPNGAQTCLASMAVNRGPGFGYLKEEDSPFWEAWRDAWHFAISQDWKGLKNHLNNFPGSKDLMKRRMREAELLNGL